ncbi:MAG: Co2+/Mg2+ efflux protein ApaG [Gammaproteobacteria bacterium]|nr:MAG: Co2+/Mg2+ efflux protein ApaG [Gammaproteobacteria bacterium]
MDRQDELGDSILIEVQSSFLADQSDPPDNRYVFAYTITIRNNGALPAKLLTRHWLITDGNGKVQEVRGDGVVGEQPRILPGRMHRYSSGAVLETPVGTMEGSYGMLSDDGTGFEARIPRFRLAVPGVLN